MAKRALPKEFEVPSSKSFAPISFCPAWKRIAQIRRTQRTRHSHALELPRSLELFEAEKRQSEYSSPVKRTISPSEEAENGVSRTDSAQNPAESESQSVKFPKVVRHRTRRATLAGATLPCNVGLSP